MKKLSAVAVLLLAAAAIFAATGSLADIENTEDAVAFSDYKVTMVNCFTTWCRYCIKEMPELQELSGRLPEGTNLIALCCDAYESPQVLAKIVEKYGITFPVIKYTTEELLEAYDLRGFPTTLFVDSKGRIIDSLTGCPRKPLDTYLHYLNELSDELSSDRDN